MRISGQPHPINFGLLQPLGLGPSVLEPNLHLGLGHLERSGEFGPLGDRQILLLFVLGLERGELGGCERRSGFSVGLVFPQMTPERQARLAVEETA